MGVLFREDRLTLEGLTGTLHVALLSDIHVKSKKSIARLEEAVQGITERDIDLVLLLGDYILSKKADISALGALSWRRTQARLRWSASSPSGTASIMTRRSQKQTGITSHSS